MHEDFHILYSEKLKDVFGNHLEFKVEVYRNATSEEIMRVCQEYSRKDHRQFDCLVFCILSHGTTGAVYGTDSNSVRIKDITACFTASRCPSLAEKPKLFFFQACQGLSHQSGMDLISMDTDFNFLPLIFPTLFQCKICLYLKCFKYYT